MKPKFYTRKPIDERGFKTAVAWFGGRELIASLKGMLMYAIYGETMDPRSWMKGNIYPNVDERLLSERVPKKATNLEADAKSSGADASGERSERDFKASNQYRDYEALQNLLADPKFESEAAVAATNEWKRKLADGWNWKRKHFAFWDDFLKHDKGRRFASPDALDEFWFDFIADTGDGQMGVFNVGCMLFSDLWIEAETIGSRVRFFPSDVSADDHPDFDRFSVLPRGQYLFVGGDTAYHSANFATLVERFQLPMRWAFTAVRGFMYRRMRPTPELTGGSWWTLQGNAQPITVDGQLNPDWDGTIALKIEPDNREAEKYWDTEPTRPLFGIPANHDYYDNIDGFNRQFRRSPYVDTQENRTYDGLRGRMFLRIPTFSREQEASYIAIRLPFDWWMFGIDSENEKLDFRQEVFFKDIIAKQPRRLILATPEPTTVFGRKADPADKTPTYLATITSALGSSQPFVTDGKFMTPGGESNEFIRLDLSGDVHHYARYWGPNSRGFEKAKHSSSTYASVVAGGGGAFFDSTSTLIGENGLYETHPSNGKTRKVRGEIPPQAVYPDTKQSIDAHAERLFDLRNISRGGYVQYAGAAFAAVISLFLTAFSSFRDFLPMIEAKGIAGVAGYFSRFGSIEMRSSALAIGAFTLVVILLSASGFLIHRLVVGLKKRMKTEDELTDDWDGRILQLVVNALPFLIAVGVYVATVTMVEIYGVVPAGQKAATLMVVLHLIGGGVLLWLGAEYTNWLDVRAKIVRSYTTPTVTERLEDQNYTDSRLYLKPIGWIARNYSYRYFVANVLSAFAVVAVVLGIGRFGTSSLAVIVSDIILLASIAVAVAFFVGLAYSTGAAYLPTRSKIGFALIGAFHAVLQVALPVILFFFTDVLAVVAIWGLVVIMSGLSLGPFGDSVVTNDPLLSKLKRINLGQFVMRRLGAWGTLAVWIVFGGAMLFAPAISKYALGRDAVTLKEYAGLAASDVTAWMRPDVRPESLTTPPDASEKLSLNYMVYISLLILVTGAVGYRLSRVWFGWYLAVTMLFNGHNNEAGGMARIEGFKHLLRVKVERDRLTVYVIGFEAAVPDLGADGLDLRLVDRFVLTNQSANDADCE